MSTSTEMPLGMLMLTSFERQNITKSYGTYKQAEKITGVPWEMIAAVHFRETNNCVNYASINTPGGFYQNDPVPGKGEMLYAFRRFTIWNEESIGFAMRVGLEDFAVASVYCGCMLRMKTEELLDRFSSSAVIKDSLWGYNGRAFGSADNASYVMNGFDAKHRDMKILGSIPDGHGGRTHINAVDKRPGAFTVFWQLKGSE